MNPLAPLLTPDHICLDVPLANKPALFARIGQLMAERHGLGADYVARSLARREHSGSTGVGHGVAIPHARVAGLPRALAAYVRPSKPMPFAAPDGQPVTDILVLLVPDPGVAEHLHLLAAVSGMLGDEGFRSRLRASTTPEAVLALISAWPGPAAP